MAKSVRRSVVKEAALSEVKDDLSRYLREAEFDYRLEKNPRFLQRVRQARASIRGGRGVRLEALKID